MNPDKVETQWRSGADQLRGKFPKLGTLMDEAEIDVLALMAFPRAHWTQIYSTNPLERTSRIAGSMDDSDTATWMSMAIGQTPSEW